MCKVSPTPTPHFLTISKLQIHKGKSTHSSGNDNKMPSPQIKRPLGPLDGFSSVPQHSRRSRQTFVCPAGPWIPVMYWSLQRQTIPLSCRLISGNRYFFKGMTGYLTVWSLILAAWDAPTRYLYAQLTLFTMELSEDSVFFWNHPKQQLRLFPCHVHVPPGAQQEMYLHLEKPLLGCLHLISSITSKIWTPSRNRELSLINTVSVPEHRMPWMKITLIWCDVIDVNFWAHWPVGKEV